MGTCRFLIYVYIYCVTLKHVTDNIYVSYYRLIVKTIHLVAALFTAAESRTHAAFVKCFPVFSSLVFSHAHTTSAQLQNYF